ncbi:MAG: hypothetical protein OXH86_03680 [Acidimicrobiaceae bacterium]|nr:hypothetical protein [Acidimicrobiaceae bacterium]
MAELSCPGLPASWLNGWLAALGATVLVPEMRLSWTDGPAAHAVLAIDDARDPLTVLVAAWPSTERIAQMPIAEAWRDCDPTEPKMPLSVFVERARSGRSHPDIWSLSSTYSDLDGIEAKNGTVEVARSKFASAAPGSNRTVHFRLQRVHGKVEDPTEQVAATLRGEPQRVEANGLGFDVTRITSLGDESAKRVDPVVEVLAFFGLARLPLRGLGVTSRGAGESGRESARQAGWQRGPDDPRLRFFWPAWKQPLGCNGVDALLDVWDPHRPATWHRLGVHFAWKSVEFIWQGNDTTRGIGSEAL